MNHFIHDLYHDQKIMKDGIVPAEILVSSKAYLKQCIGFNPRRGICCHVTGANLLRHHDGQIYVLEANLSCPSGISYLLETRAMLKRIFPQVFAASKVRAMANYPWASPNSNARMLGRSWASVRLALACFVFLSGHY
jgi:uncharacterized circularly permuted ATP-grasp superfamily protein